MHRTKPAALLIGALVIALGGCGGSGPLPPAPPGGADANTTEIGPLVIRTASAAGFVVENVGSDRFGSGSLVALHGSEITYLASQAMLDRIVYNSGAVGETDVFVCNLDGSNRVRLTNNAAFEIGPTWSPDGTSIAFSRMWPGQDFEVMTMNADGSSITALTANAAVDSLPAWSPEGRRIAFHSDRLGNSEIHVMYRDGSAVANLTANAATDVAPDWSPDPDEPKIAFVSDRDGNQEIYTMHTDGSGATRVTTNLTGDNLPAFHPNGDTLAYQGTVQGWTDVIAVRASSPSDTWVLSASAGDQQMPAWSSDGRFVCYASSVGADYELVLQQTEEPWGKFAITQNGVEDIYPHLGSPTLQTDRVLIGSPGSDWGGADPLWTSAYAAIVAFADDGYRSLVRIGIRAADLGSLQVSPLQQTAQAPPTATGVVVEANEIVNLREDGGRGHPPIIWDLNALDPTAAVLYFHPWTGKLVSVMVIDDTSYPAGTDAPAQAVRESLRGGTLVVEGDFAAVFDADGRRISQGATRVTIDPEGAITAG